VESIHFYFPLWLLNPAIYWLAVGISLGLIVPYCLLLFLNDSFVVCCNILFLGLVSIYVLGYPRFHLLLVLYVGHGGVAKAF